MAVEVFISYSHKDRKLRDEFDAHLSNLRNQEIISDWYDGDVLPGTEREEQIMDHLKTSQIILLLISKDFLASKFCYSVELKEAIARHNANQARVLPVILRPTDWEGAPFAKLQVLPTDARPVVMWSNRDAAFKDVVAGIRRAIQDLNAGTPGGDPTVNVANKATPQPVVSTAYREIAGLPPPTDQQFIEQRIPLVEAIVARLLQPNLNALVLTGMGGVGKSTLAALLYRHVQSHQESAAGYFAAPSLWLSVDGSATFADLVETLYHKLSKSSPDLTSLSPANQAVALFSLLDSLEVPRLIVMDQFENLLDWSTGFALPTKAGVGEWLDALNSQPFTGGSRVVLTSRPRPKGTRAYPPISVQEYPVDGLTLTEGMDLLQKRGVQASETVLRRAVASCNGHALSLTLLIALVQDYGMSLASLLSEAGLWEGDIATNLLDAIFQQLSEVQRELLRAFSIYRESVPLAAAQVITSPAFASQILPALRGLLIQHLIQSAGEDHYKLHAIVASYARHHFIEGDRQANQQEVQQAHAKAAEYYLQEAQTSCPPREQRRHISEVQPIIEAVWQYTQAALWQEAYTLFEDEGLFERLSLWGGNALLLEMCQLLLPREGWQPAPEQEATLFYYLGQAQDVLGKKSEALDHYQQALTIYREVGDRISEGSTLNNLGLVYDSLGKKSEALDYYQQALVIGREVGDSRGEGVTLNNLGSVYNSLGKQSEAQDYYQQALVIGREVGDSRGEGVTLNNLGLVYDSLGKKSEALDYYQQALEIYREVGDRRGEGVTLNNLGSVYDDLGQKQEALDYYQQALEIYREMGDRRNEGVTLSNLGSVYNSLGKKPEALDYYQQALVIGREVGDRRGEGITLWNIGAFFFQQQYDVALAALLLAQEVLKEVQDPQHSDVEEWIDSLRQHVGEQQFAELLAHVEPQAQQIVEQALRKK